MTEAKGSRQKRREDVAARIPVIQTLGRIAAEIATYSNQEHEERLEEAAHRIGDGGIIFFVNLINANAGKIIVKNLEPHGFKDAVIIEGYQIKEFLVGELLANSLPFVSDILAKEAKEEVYTPEEKETAFWVARNSILTKRPLIVLFPQEDLLQRAHPENRDLIAAGREDTLIMDINLRESQRYTLAEKLPFRRGVSIDYGIPKDVASMRREDSGFSRWLDSKKQALEKAGVL